MNTKNEPIIAIATATGRGGIGVIRISGKDLTWFMMAFFGEVLKPRYAHYLPFKEASGELIDEGIAIYFKTPHSYTGEDVLELQGHGGTAVLKRLLTYCLSIGKDHHLRLADAGEFTHRAFLNNRIDLAQAEAVADLIDASSEAAARSAMISLSGKFSLAIQDLDHKIIHLRMLVEATLDFPEEDIEFLEHYQAMTQLETINFELQGILKQTKQGALIREGLYVVLAGEPNVGKSSLLNALAGEEIAIVTPIAGTTRDKVSQEIHINGIPLHIIDTAGLRDTQDQVEHIGIQRSWAEIEKANVILHLQEYGQNNVALSEQLMNKINKNVPVLKVFNKIDLHAVAPYAKDYEFGISASQSLGLDLLINKLLDIAGYQTNQENTWIARTRHIKALEDCQYHLDLAKNSAHEQALDIFAEELRLAHESLNSITGEFTSDDLLGEIFSSFCIGK